MGLSIVDAADFLLFREEETLLVPVLVNILRISLTLRNRQCVET
jgi:hypothetical protein